jgi:hypothetical protein
MKKSMKIAMSLITIALVLGMITINSCKKDSSSLPIGLLMTLTTKQSPQPRLQTNMAGMLFQQDKSAKHLTLLLEHLFIHPFQTLVVQIHLQLSPLVCG